MRPLNVGISGKQMLAGCVIKNKARSGSNDVVKYRRRQTRRTDCRVSNIDSDSPLSNLSFCFDPRFVIAQEDQVAALSAGMLDNDFHQALDERVQHDLARDRL